LAYEGDPKVQKRESYREGAVISRNLRSATTGTVSESNREIFEQLEMDGVDLEEEVEDSTWKETMNALEDRERKRAAISDPKRLVKVENLSEEVTEEDLLELFKGRSQKLKTLIPRDGEGKRLGYGLVSFRTARDAVTSRLKLDRTMLKGEKIICRWLGNRKARTRGLGVGGKGLFKGEDPGRWVEPVQTKDA
jgi:RNA recognition motif-containing protein